MMNVILNVASVMMVLLSIWVFIDGKKNQIEKSMKWALLMLVNPFAIKKYLKIRNEQVAS